MGKGRKEVRRRRGRTLLSEVMMQATCDLDLSIIDQSEWRSGNVRVFLFQCLPTLEAKSMSKFH
jgi:hypothetical protein